MPTKDPRLATFGPEVRRRRKALGLTVEELAERAELSTNYVGAVERGEKNPSLSTVTAMASGLGVSARVLITSEDVGETKLGSRGHEFADLFDTLPVDLQDAVFTVLRATLRPKT